MASHRRPTSMVALGRTIGALATSAAVQRRYRPITTGVGNAVALRRLFGCTRRPPSLSTPMREASR